MPEQERVASGKHLQATFMAKESQVVGNLVKDGTPNKLTDMRGCLPSLPVLAPPLVDWTRCLKIPESAMGGNDRDDVGQILGDLIGVTNACQSGSEEREKEERRMYSWAVRQGAWAALPKTMPMVGKRLKSTLVKSTRSRMMFYAVTSDSTHH